MARQKRDTKAILKVIERSGDRSDLFWWMVEQHDEIIRKANGKRINWPSVCAEAARRGRMDRLGQPPSVMTAKKTWQRARKEVEAARAAESANPAPRVNPSRFEKEWRPANAPPPPPPSGGQALVPVPTAGRSHSLSLDELRGIRKNTSEDDDEFDPVANKARLRRIFAERDGH
jgi:hypothetical protein